MHEVVLAAQAKRDLKRLPADVFRRVIAAVRALAATPRLYRPAVLTWNRLAFAW